MKRLILTLLAAMLVLHTYSVSNVFEYLTTDNGLSHNTVTCIFQDHYGFMWFGTFNGLNRYDGYELISYNYDADNDNSLSHQHINQICEDNTGKIWLATNKGITVFDPVIHTFYRIASTLMGDDEIHLERISSIIRGPEGNIWFLDETEGVFVFNDDLKLVYHYRLEETSQGSYRPAKYYAIDFDKEGTAWIGIGKETLGKILPHSDDIKTTIFETPDPYALEEIQSVYVDRSGMVWIGTGGQGAYKYDPTRDQFINYRKESEEYHISGNFVMAFAEDRKGNLLIGVDGGGINIINPVSGSLSLIQYDLGNLETLNTNAIYALYTDKTGNLWAGTYAGGVNFYSLYKNRFKKYLPNPLNANSLSYKNVTAFLQDKDGDIWIGTDGGGLNKFDPATGSFTHYRADPDNPKGLQTDVIIHLMQDDEGDIYISSYNHGLTILNKRTMTWKQYLPDDNDPKSIAGRHPWFTYQDSYGDIWVGLLVAGLDKFNKATKSFKHYPYRYGDPNSLNGPNIIVLCEDSERELWIGSEGGGLHKYNRDEDNFTRYFADGSEGSLISDDVRAIFEDSRQRFWVGTGMGLCLMDRDRESFKTITAEFGLPGDQINGILEDDSGKLWISTDNGISMYNPDLQTFRNYDKSDGLQGNEFNYTAAMKLHDGHLFFGGKNGFNMFLPSEIEDNPVLPRVVITRISILDTAYRHLPVRKDGRTVNVAVHALRELKLDPEQNIFSIEFAALEYSNPMKNMYAYKLEGFDQDWRLTDASNRLASYMNLPEGSYTFRIKASNNDGIWNENGSTLKILVSADETAKNNNIPVLNIILIILGAMIVAGLTVLIFIRKKKSI